MDITDALAPASDQLDAVELVDPRTFTIDTGSRLGKREGKTVAEIRLVGFDRVWRPSKGMLDVLAACWGTNGEKWTGHRVTVYNDRSVTFGKERTGGVRISHLSHIDEARDVTIRANGAGRTQLWHIEPLSESQVKVETEPTADQVAACTDPAELRVMWHAAGPERRTQITARVAELNDFGGPNIASAAS